MKNNEDLITINSKDIIIDSEVETKKKKFFDKFSKTDPNKLKYESVNKMNIGPVKKVWKHVQTLWTIVKSDSIPLQQKAMAVGALVYLISPIDAIPDAIPLLGLTDDVAIITMVITQLAPFIKALNKKK